MAHLRVFLKQPLGYDPRPRRSQSHVDHSAESKKFFSSFSQRFSVFLSNHFNKDSKHFFESQQSDFCFRSEKWERGKTWLTKKLIQFSTFFLDSFEWGHLSCCRYCCCWWCCGCYCSCSFYYCCCCWGYWCCCRCCLLFKLFILHLKKNSIRNPLKHRICCWTAADDY